MFEALKNSLAHVFWIGGSPCSGKSSISEILAETHQLRVYHADEAFEGHRKLVTARKQPMLHKWTSTPWNQLWTQPVDVLLRETIACHREHFGMIVDDLVSQADSRPVVVEGASLLPDCLNEVLLDRRRAIWVVPTEEFQRAHYPNRGSWVQRILSECEDPEQAFENWMDRDAQFAKWIIEQTRELRLECMGVDGKQSVVENANLVARHFDLA